MAKADSLYQVKESFVGNVRGAEAEYHKGELVNGDDPGYRKWPELFEPLLIRGHSGVEQATAAPGEKRHLSLKRKASEPAPEPEPEPEPEPPVGKAMTLASLKGK